MRIKMVMQITSKNNINILRYADQTRKRGKGAGSGEGEGAYQFQK